MSLRAIWFLKEGNNGPSKVLPFRRVEILGPLLVKAADLLIHLVVHSFLPRSPDSVLDVISVFPLIPGEVMQASEQAFDPLLGGLPSPGGVVVALLELTPLLAKDAFQ